MLNSLEFFLFLSFFPPFGLRRVLVGLVLGIGVLRGWWMGVVALYVEKC